MRPMFQILSLEAASALLYMFGNRFMDLAVVFFSIYMAVSVPLAPVENALPSTTSVLVGVTPADRAVSCSHMVTLLRPGFLYMMLAYTLLLKDVWLDNFQWTIAQGAAALVALNRIKVHGLP